MFVDHIVQKPNNVTIGSTIPIDWDGFKRMLTYNNVNRRFSNPWLVESCLTKLQKRFNGSVEVSQIHVERRSLLKIDAKNRQLVKMSDNELLETNIESIVGSKAIIKMEVNGLVDGYSPSIAISLSGDGEQVAFGGAVTICSNLTIFNKDRFFSTHKRHSSNKKRMTPEELLKEIDGLFPRMEEVLEEDLSLIDKYKNEPVTRKQWDAFVGSLFGRIHYVNRKRLKREIAGVPAEMKQLPVTASSLADIVAEAIEPAHDVYRFQDGMTSVWNCINYGTEQLKTEHGISPHQVLQANTNWAELVMKHSFTDN